MSDFETHPLGTRFEITASRDLAREIEQTIKQWGPGVIPDNITKAYYRLCEQYARNIEAEEER